MGHSRLPALPVVKTGLYGDMNGFQVLGQDPLAWYRRSLRSKGISNTLRVAWHSALDCLFDLRYRTETTHRIDRERIVTDSENKQFTTNYGATRSGTFLRLLDELQLPRSATFVDLGAGKGRVLMLAAKWGFKRVVGVEFSAPLCALASTNLELFQQQCPLNSTVEILHQDVVNYPFPPGDLVIFLFNPFYNNVLEKVLANLRESLRTAPRNVWLLYSAPAAHQTVLDSGIFASAAHRWVCGTEFRVYSNVMDFGR